jgi:hypothetical protein
VRRFLALLLFLSVASAFAEEFPYLLQIDSKNEVSYNAKTLSIWGAYSGCCEGSIWNGKAIGPNKFEFDLSTNDQPKTTTALIGVSRALADHRWSSIRPILIDHLSYATNLTFPGGIKGTIDNEMGARFPFEAKAGEPLLFEVVANRLGSQLDPVVRILDANGNERAYADDHSKVGRDCLVEFLPRRAGRYTLEIFDVARGFGPDYFFCLRSGGGEKAKRTPRLFPCSEYLLDPNWTNASPRLTLNVGSEIEGHFSTNGKQTEFNLPVEKKQKLIISVKTREFGGASDAGLGIFDSENHLIAEAVGAEANGPSITNTFEKTGTYTIRVREISKLADRPFWLAVAEVKPGVELSVETERISFANNGEAKLKIACQRFEYEGPVKLKIEGLPKGVTVAEDTISKGKKEGELLLKGDGIKEGFQIKITATIEGDEENEFYVSTMPALKKLFPMQLFPSAAMDGWIAVNPP